MYFIVVSPAGLGWRFTSCATVACQQEQSIAFQPVTATLLRINALRFSCFARKFIRREMMLAA